MDATRERRAEERRQRRVEERAQMRAMEEAEEELLWQTEEARMQQRRIEMVRWLAELRQESETKHTLEVVRLEQEIAKNAEQLNSAKVPTAWAERVVPKVDTDMKTIVQA